MENRVDVVINGDVIKIKSSESIDYLQRLAHYTGVRINEISERYATIMISERERTLLMALNIADDYFKAEPEMKRLTAENKHLLKECTDVHDENIKLTERMHSLERELAQMRLELDEALNNSDEKIISLHQGRKAIG